MWSYGSSPRVWGILLHVANRGLRERFIPTRVGNTRRRTRSAYGQTVHPHACGEYDVHAGSPGLVVGSSPRVWGIQPRRTQKAEPRRFIPTRVGNTARGCPPRCGRTVHPHACGEYFFMSRTGDYENGSSPRVWGIRGEELDLPTDKRFIPTRVGNTMYMPDPQGWSSVHPHACGEYSRAAHRRPSPGGSSPRVWGILFRKMQEITDCWQSSSVLPSHVCCKPAPMTIKRGRSFVKRLLPLVKHCPAGQSRSLDVTCPDRRNARPRS